MILNEGNIKPKPLYFYTLTSKNLGFPKSPLEVSVRSGACMQPRQSNGRKTGKSSYVMGNHRLAIQQRLPKSNFLFLKVRLREFLHNCQNRRIFFFLQNMFLRLFNGRNLFPLPTPKFTQVSVIKK